jgi:peptidoglycan/LPS O-acetylase OafA/YrhL
VIGQLPNASPWIIFGASLLSASIAATASWYVIEKPMMKLGKTR